MHLIAAIAIGVGLMVSRVLAVLVNCWLWLRLLAPKPSGSPLVDYARQIYLPVQARKGAWPGLLFFLPLMWAGMAIGQIDRQGVSFSIGMAITIAAGVLACGAIWSLQGNPFPNRKLAETRLALISQSLESNPAAEPISRYRHFWRASYLWELISVSTGSTSGFSAASLQKVEGFLGQYEENLRQALAGLGSGDKLRSTVQGVMADNESAIVGWRKRLSDLSNQKKMLLEAWPAAAAVHQPASLRITQMKPAFLVRGLKFDDIDLTDLIVQRKSETTIVLPGVHESSGLLSDGVKKRSRPWFGEFDVLVPATLGTHKLTIESSPNTYEHLIQIDSEGRSVALISFDVYADRLVVECLTECFEPRRKAKDDFVGEQNQAKA